MPTRGRNMLYHHDTVNTAYAVSAMEALEPALYDVRMDIGAHLGRNLKKLRTRMGLTQEAWAAKAGVDQGWVSKVERGLEGWSALQGLVDQIERVGGDPLELLNPDAARGSAEEAELLALFRQAQPELRKGTLSMLRTVIQASSPRSADGIE